MQGAQILYVRRVSLSWLKITLGLLFLVGLGCACSFVSVFLGISVPVYVLMGVGIAMGRNYKWLLSAFYVCHDRDDSEGTRVALYTEASREGDRRSSKVFVVKPHATLEGDPIVRFRDCLYRVREGKASKLKELEVLKLLGIQDVVMHLKTGLSGEKMEKSKAIFGEQKNFITPLIWRFVLLHFEQQSWSLYTVLGSLLLASSLEAKILIAHLILSAVILALLLVAAWRQSSSFHQRNGWIASRDYRVRRDSKELEVGVGQLLVGDVVCPGKEEEFVFWFGAILAGELDLVVREGAKQSIKLALKQVSDMSGEGWERHVIKALARVERGQLKQGQQFLVTDHNCINRWFTRWFEKQSYEEFGPFANGYWPAARKLSVVGLVLAVVLYGILSLVFNRSFGSIGIGLKTGIELSIVLFPPLLLVLRWVVLTIIAVRLSREQMDVFGGNLAQLGASSSQLVINFSRLLHLEFEQILYKNKILGFQTEQFEPSGETLKNGATYESLLAVVLYLSLGKFDEENSLHYRVYEKFKTYFEHVDSLGEHEDVVHVSSGKRWELMKVLPENEEGMRSWIVQYDSRTFYLISEMGLGGQDPFQLLGDKEDQRKKETYYGAAKELQNQGKLLRLMIFRNLKEERLSASTKDGDYANWSRTRLERDFQFGTFVVFDQALMRESVDAVEELKADGFSLTFISSSNSESLAGFEHILTNIPFIYGSQEEQTGRQVRSKMGQGGCIFVGGALEDIKAWEVADVAVQVRRGEQQLLLPGDVSIPNVGKLIFLLELGRQMLEVQIETFKLAFVVLFFQLMGSIYLDRKGLNLHVREEFQWGLITIGVFVILPTFLRLLLGREEWNKLLKPRGIFTSNYWILLAVASVIAAGLVWLSQLWGLCKLQPFHLRGSQEGKECVNLMLLLGGSAGVLGFSIIYGIRSCFTSDEQWLRLFLFPVWLLLLVLVGVDWPLLVVVGCVVLLPLLIKFLVKMIVCM